MKRLLLLALGLMVFTLNAQSLQWAKQIGGPGTDGSTAMVLDASGNVYKLGSFRYTADFDPSANTYNMTANGQGDLFIAKLDIDGDFIWAIQIGQYYDSEEAADIALDSNGNILVGGSFRNTLDLDPGVGELNVTTEGKAAFLLKLDPQGNLIWATHWGGNDYQGENTIYNIVLDDADNILIGGGFYGTNDLDPGAGTYSVTASSREDAYLTKLDSNGSFLWAMAFGGDASGLDRVKTVAVEGTGNIVISGGYYGNVPAYNLTGNGNFYIKLDASGNLVWSKQTAGNGYILSVNSLKLDADGNLYMTGVYLGTCDFDPGAGVYNLSSSGGFIDIFILKLTATGDFVWAKSIGGPEGLDAGRSIELDNQGYLYVTGNYKGETDFDPGTGEFILTPIAHIDMFILKLDTDGNFEYANTFGSTTSYGDTIGTSIQSDGSGNVYFSGVFLNTTDFDPSGNVFNLVSQGGDDVFILKLNGDPLSIAENELLNTSLYPNPSNGNFSVDLGKEYQNVTVEILNILGQRISFEQYSSAKTIDNEITGTAGIYFVKVNSNKEGSKTLRIIKQ